MNSKQNSILYITGGGGLAHNCINITTLASILTASFGVNVIKHVSYQSNKKCSNAEFLDQLDIKIAHSIGDVEESLEKNSIVFVEASPELVIDNVCPLIATSKYTSRFVGTNNYENGMKYLFELKAKGYKRAIVVSPFNENYDEVSVCSATQIFELKNNEISNYIISPKDYLISQVEDIQLTGATSLYNANLAIDIFSNKIKGAKLDSIVFNSAIMLYVVGYVKDIKKGIISSYLAIESGKALSKLETLRRK